RNPGPRIDAIKPGLVPAPDSETGRETAPDRTRDCQAAVSEQVAAADADHASLGIGVEEQIPAERLLVEPAFREKRESRATGAELPDRLPALRGDRHRDRGEGCEPYSSGDLSPA